MTANETPEKVLNISPPAPSIGIHWRVAWESLREIMTNPDDTRRAIDFFYAIGPGAFERNFQRFVAEPAGRALLRERPSLGHVLSDRTRLAQLPPDSFGRAYLDQMDKAGLDPLGLIALQHQVMQRWEDEFNAPRLDPFRAWFRDRFILMHDLFHVLSGYGTDELGEAALLAFSHAQLGGRGWGFLAVGATVQSYRVLGASWLVYVYRAWRRGRRARWLAGLPFEELLPLPLKTVRQLTGLETPDVEHPGGLLRGNWSPSVTH